MSFESVMFLTQVAKNDNQGGSNNFCNGGIEMKLFHKQFYKGIVQ